MTGLPPEYFRGSLFGGVANRTRVDPYDLPPVPAGFERIAAAADEEMFAGLSEAVLSSERGRR